MAVDLQSGSGKGGSITPNINVTPLVDVVLVLLIIFMLVIPNVQNEGKPIEMLKVEAADMLTDDEEPIIVTVDRDEHYLVGAQELPRDEAVQQVIALASANPRQRVLLRADAQLPYRPVRELFAGLQEGGLVNIALAVGTARYASPEQALGRRLDGRPAVYSLALVLVRDLPAGQCRLAGSIAVDGCEHVPNTDPFGLNSELPLFDDALANRLLGGREPRRIMPTATEAALPFSLALFSPRSLLGVPVVNSGEIAHWLVFGSTDAAPFDDVALDDGDGRLARGLDEVFPPATDEIVEDHDLARLE